NEATIRNVFLHTFCVNFRNIHSFPTRRSSDLIVRRSSRLRPDRVYNWFRTRFGASGVATNPSVTKQAMVLRDCVRDLRYSWRQLDRKSTRLNSSHVAISYAVYCMKKKRSERTS